MSAEVKATANIPKDFKEVEKDEFYNFIKNEDVVVSSFTDFTYFKIRNGMTVGMANGYARRDNLKFYALRS